MNNEDVERVAEVIYAAMRFGRESDTPAWVHKGNSHAQVEARRAARAAMLAQVVKVKPLEWVDYPAVDGHVLSTAVTPLGTYFIVDDTDDFTGLYLALISHDNAKWWQHVRSTQEVLMEGVHDDDMTPIKAAAQADYERRILSVLEPPQTPANGHSADQSEEQT